MTYFSTWHYVRDFDIIFHLALCKRFWHNFSTWLQSTMKDFHMIFHFNAAENVVAEHYEWDFDKIFHFKAAQNVVALHYERDFDMNFSFKTAQHLVAEDHERDFEIIFHFMVALNLVRSTVWKKMGWLGPALMTMNNNRFNLVLDSFTVFTRKKARRWKISS